MATLTLPVPAEMMASGGSPPSMPVLRLVEPGKPPRTVSLADGKWTIGASSRCQIRLAGAQVKPLQCVIAVAQRSATVTRWAAGILLNGSEFRACSLQPGDRLTVGGCELLLEGLNPSTAKTTLVELGPPPTPKLGAIEPIKPASLEPSTDRIYIDLNASPEWRSSPSIAAAPLSPAAPWDDAAGAIFDWPTELTPLAGTIHSTASRPTEAATPRAATFDSTAFGDRLVLHYWQSQYALRQRAQHLVIAARRARDQADAVREELNAAKQQLTRIQAESSAALAAQAMQTEENLHETRLTAEAWKRELEAARHEQAAADQRARDLAAQIDAASARVESLEAQLSSVQAAAETATAALAAANCERDELSNAASAAVAARNEFEKAAEQAAATLAQRESELAAIRRDRDSDACELHAAQGNFDSLSTELESTRVQNESLKSELESTCAGHAAVCTELESVRVQSQSLTAELESTRTEHAAIYAEFESARIQNESLTADLESTRTEHAAVCTELESARLQSQSLTAELESTRTEHAAIYAEFESARVQNESLTAELETKRSEHAAVNAELESARLQSQSLTAELESTRTEHAAVCTELESARHEKEALTAEFELTQSRVQSLTTDLESIQTRVESLSTDLAAGDEARQALANELESARIELAQQAQALSEAQAAASAAAQLEALTAEQERLHAELNAAADRLEEQAATIAERNGRLAELSETLESLRVELTNSETHRQELYDQVQSLETAAQTQLAPPAVSPEAQVAWTLPVEGPAPSSAPDDEAESPADPAPVWNFGPTELPSSLDAPQTEEQVQTSDQAALASETPSKTTFLPTDESPKPQLELSGTDASASNIAPAAPTSFIERYQQLLESEGGAPANSRSSRPRDELLDAEFLPAQSRQKPPREDDGDEALEFYMARLMERVKTGSALPADAPGASASSAVTSYMTGGVEPALLAEPPAPGTLPRGVMDLEELRLRARKNAPQLDLTAMREVAKSTAMNAIASHSDRRSHEAAYSRLMICVIFAVAAAALMFNAPETNSLQFWGGIAAAIGGIWSGAQVIHVSRRRYAALSEYRRAAAEAFTPIEQIVSDKPQAAATDSVADDQPSAEQG